MSERRHAELLTKFGGTQYMINIYYQRQDSTQVYGGSLGSWREFLRLFRPYYRWRVRAERGDIAVIITSKISGWIPETNRRLRS